MNPKFAGLRAYPLLSRGRLYLVEVIMRSRATDTGIGVRCGRSVANRPGDGLLTDAHAQGIAHRDVKPPKVMVGPYREVMLMDWGVARAADPESRNGLSVVAGRSWQPPRGEQAEQLVKKAVGATVGTPLYMAPEQLSDPEHVGPRSDLDSACVLFHEFMILRHYLDEDRAGGQVGVWLGGLQRDRPIPIGSGLARWNHLAQSYVPMDCIHVIRRGLHKAPELRWGSAEAIIGELERIVDGRITVVCPTTPAKRGLRGLMRSTDRHPTAFPVLVVGTLVTTAATLGAVIVMGVQALLGT